MVLLVRQLGNFVVVNDVRLQRCYLNVLGFMVLGFMVLGFMVVGFIVLGFHDTAGVKVSLIMSRMGKQMFATRIFRMCTFVCK